MVAESISHHADRARSSKALETLARAGYAVSGVLHLLVGWIAVRIALGRGGGEADQTGALSEVASAPGGQVLLWLGVAGFTALGLWQLAEASFGGSRSSGSSQGTHRAKAGGKAVVHLALAFVALQFARGSRPSGAEKTADFTASLMQSGAGRALVVLIGLAMVGVGVYHVYKGASHKFLEDLRTTGAGAVGSTVERLGIFGYVAKGIALGVVGLLFLVAAVQSDPSEARGLDGALKALQEQPAGMWLLIAVAVGIAAFGLYSFGRARYARM